VGSSSRWRISTPVSKNFIDLRSSEIPWRSNKAPPKGIVDLYQYTGGLQVDINCSRNAQELAAYSMLSQMNITIPGRKRKR